VTMTLGTEAIVREVEALAADRRSTVHPIAPTPLVRPNSAPKAVAPPTPVPVATPHERPKAKAALPAPRPAAPAPTPPPAPRAAPKAASPPLPGPPDDPEHAAAMRLARIIVSDTALYNEKAVQEAIRTGRLRETILGLLDEGRQHYAERTPDHVRADTDYLGAALDQFVARKTQAMKPTVV
jgi:hypothetical protein